MPTINIFYNDQQELLKLNKVVPHLKEYVAKQLTCGDIQLKSEEVSIRLIKNSGGGMLAPIELEVKAAAFKERVDKQDEICLDIQKFLIDSLKVEDVKVWLILAELGHSWK